MDWWINGWIDWYMSEKWTDSGFLLMSDNEKDRLLNESIPSD